MRGIMEQEPAKRILLGVTGGIAAYKAAELLRLLMKQGIEVQVAMTEAACHFITPTTMQGLSGKPVLIDQWDMGAANSMARISPLLVAPAMNREMWQNAATQRNIAQLLADGVQVLGPDCGMQACGEEGMGRMLEAERLEIGRASCRERV